MAEVFLLMYTTVVVLDDYFGLEKFFCYVLDVQFLRLLYFFEDWIWELDFSLVGMKKLKHFKTKHLVFDRGSLNHPNLGESKNANAWWLGNGCDFPYFIVPCLSC